MHNPFTSLHKNKKLRAKLQSRGTKPKASPGPEQKKTEADNDADLFLHATHGVTPMDKRGRDIARSSPPPSAPLTQAPSFKQLLEDNIEFEMEHTHEYLTGQLKGLDAKIFRKLQSGQYSVQGHLDLHGMNTTQAQIAVLDFVRRNFLEGKRCVLLIPGRGRNSPMGQGVLRQEISTWLTQAPLKRIILAFCTAQPKHGGSGAIYLLLRQARKASGKIFWQDIFIDLEG